MKNLFDLFLTFFKIGCIAFGGGYAILPVLERELVKRKGWVSMDEVIEYWTIGQITPGIIALNIATFIGYKRGKIPGAIVATIAFFIPGISLVICAGLFLQQFQNIKIVQHAFAGIRLTVCALIIQTVVKLASSIVKKEQGLLQNGVYVGICALCLALSLVWNTNPILLVLCSGLAGFVCFGRKRP
jgi:chromate transporter